MTFSAWNSADWVSISLSIVLFGIAWWLSKRQGQIIDNTNRLLQEVRSIISNVDALTRQVHSLGEATAALQIVEKIGVIGERTAEVNKKSETAIHTLVGDVSSVLPLYEYAPKRLVARYEDALCGALVALARRKDDAGHAKLRELRDTVESHVSDLQQRKLATHATALQACIATASEIQVATAHNPIATSTS